MYGNVNLKKELIVNDDPIKLKEFELCITLGEKIEPKDWMPELYRKQLIRMIEQHAHSEIIGSLPEGTWGRWVRQSLLSKNSKYVSPLS